MYNWPFSDLEHFYYTWFAPSYSETISFGVVVKSTIRAFRKHIYFIYLYSFLYITRASKCKTMTTSDVLLTLFHFFGTILYIFKLHYWYYLTIVSIWYVGLGLYHQKLEVLEQISGHKVQLKSKSHTKRMSMSIMFQLPPQIILDCSKQ